MAPSQVRFLNLRKTHQEHQAEFLSAVQSVMESGLFVNGPAVEKFESEFSAFLGVGFHSVGVGNGTEAISLAIRACTLSPDSEVLLPANTFVATVEAVLNAGLKPKLVDVTPGTYLMNPQEVEKAMTPRVRLIIPVHLYGQMAPMDEVASLARDHSCKIIEDASQAHGAQWEGKPPGTWGEAATFSFFPGKNLGAMGDGGLVVSRSKSFRETCASLGNHGGLKKYEHLLPGATNSRLDAIQAAVLSVKLKYLGQWNEHRRKVAGWYKELLGEIPELELPKVSSKALHVHHLFVVKTEKRDALSLFLKERGIETGIHYPLPIHALPVYRETPLSKGSFPVSEALARTCLSLPMCPTLTQTEVEYVADGVRSFFGRKN